MTKSTDAIEPDGMQGQTARQLAPDKDAHGDRAGSARRETNERRGPSSQSRASAWLAASLVLPLALAGYGIFKDHDTTLRRDMDNSRNLADSVQVYVTETLNQTAFSLRGIEHNLEGLPNPTAESQLAALREAMRYDPSSWVVGVQNDVGTRMVDTEGIELRMPELENVVAETLRRPGKLGLSILPAVYSKEYLDWYLPVRVRYTRAGGHVETVFALVAATKLVRTAANLPTPSGGFLAFATPTGLRLFKYLGAEQEIQVTSAALAPVTVEHLLQGGNGNFETTGATSHELLRIGYSTSDRFPLGIVVAVPASNAELAWLRQTSWQIAFAMLAVLAVGFFAYRLKLVHGALNWSQTLYRDLFEAAGEGLLVLDARGTVQTCNPGALRIMGASASSELLGRDLMSLTSKGQGEGRTHSRGLMLLETLTVGQSLCVDWRFEKMNHLGEVDVEMRISAFPTGSMPFVTVLLQDVGAERKHLREQEYMASHDSLTGLFNRYAFQAAVSDRIAEEAGQTFAVMLLDLNRFKEINDTLGHHAGDAVLRELGSRLQKFFGQGPGVVARLGGDEISVCAPIADIADGLEALCATLLAQLGEVISVDGISLELTASLGIAVYPDDADNPSELLRCADIAMYAAKRELRSHQRYHADLDNFSAESLALQADFARAMRGTGLTLVYQPKVDMRTGLLVGVEALSRWVHATLGPIPPSTFIPLVENSELIHAFTEYVLREALSQSSEWAEAGYQVPISVNISAHNLMNASFIELVRTLLESYCTPADQLELELTESALMRNPEIAAQRLGELRALGVKLSIDDFGTGYASLAYLKSLPVDVLKIDKSFTTALSTDAADRRIVRSTIDLAHGFGMQVVAEGVETAEVAELLRLKGCDIAQGYLYSRPIGPEELVDKWLAVRTSRGGPDSKQLSGATQQAPVLQPTKRLSLA